ncbi:MAG: hypothetical protein ACR2OO_16460, partial [Thermomicrobiales bacterium]
AAGISSAALAPVAGAVPASAAVIVDGVVAASVVAALVVPLKRRTVRPTQSGLGRSARAQADSERTGETQAHRRQLS